MKTTILQPLFKIALLLTCMAIGFGCDDSDEWGTEGMDMTGQLVKVIENGAEISFPTDIAPHLILKKDLTFKSDIVCNSIQGNYRYNTDNGKFAIENLIMTELSCISPYGEAESLYRSYLSKVSSFKLEKKTFRLYFGKDSYLEYELKSEKK